MPSLQKACGKENVKGHMGMQILRQEIYIQNILRRVNLKIAFIIVYYGKLQMLFLRQGNIT